MKGIIILLLVVPALLAYSNSECSSLCFSLYPNKTPQSTQQFVFMSSCLQNCDQENSVSQRFLSECSDACPQTDEMQSIYECVKNCRGLSSFNLEATAKNYAVNYTCAFYADPNCTTTQIAPSSGSNATNSTCQNFSAPTITLDAFYLISNVTPASNLVQFYGPGAGCIPANVDKALTTLTNGTCVTVNVTQVGTPVLYGKCINKQYGSIFAISLAFIMFFLALII